MKNNNCVINTINVYQIIPLNTLEYSKQEKNTQKNKNKREKKRTNKKEEKSSKTYDGENPPYSPKVWLVTLRTRCL